MRTLLLFILIKSVQETEVKTLPSLAEKEWVLTTLGVILAFFVLIWVFQSVMSCLSINANSIAAGGFIIYSVGSGMGEFMNHVL